MEGKAKLTSKGQITIPINVRRALKLEEGDTLHFHVSDGVAVMQAEHEDNPFAAFSGIYLYRTGKGDTIKDIVAKERKTRGW